MKEFLRSVVEHYLPQIKLPDGTCDCLGLADNLFVFPNRRSGLFFNKYLLDSLDSPVFAPDMTTISELFTRLTAETPMRVPDRIEQLFRLFAVYREVSGSNESFDSFVFWGEMLLSDFNDVDKYLVDAAMLFRNVRDLKEIDEQFAGLEPEQIKVIRTFWTNFNPDSATGQSKELFRQTWKILFELYSRFRQELAADGAAYDGMLQRRIIEDLHQKKEQLGFDEEKERLQRLLGKKVVFVGLTALSKTETELMEHLMHYGMADFCWDYADSRLNDRHSHASYFRASTVGVFPNVLDEDELRAGLVPDGEKNIEIIEVPSGVGQTVQAASVLRKWNGEGFDAFRTAVVLPDEKMLLPMLYSVPKDFEPFNVTMGYSLKATGIATFVGNLAQLQANIQRSRDGRWTFYHKNVLPLLSTNFIMQMSDGKAEEVAREITRNNRFRISEETFRGNLLLEKVFRPCSDVRSSIVYLEEILSLFASQAEKELAEQEAGEEQDREDVFGTLAEEERRQGIFSEIDREFLYTYITLVKSLEEKITKFPVEFSTGTFFSLLNKLTQTEMVAFSGEPLSGLQVMGVLETRGLDFDNLVILSMNEGVFPAKPLTNTFVPMNLRAAFGMPTQAHRDAVFAYHFYRLISRARKIVLIYDSRSEGMQSGEPSRYVKQLTYLYGFKPKMKTVQYNIGVESSSPIVVEKDERVMAKLHQCVCGVGVKKLSASVIKRYISCPLRFYLEFVEGLREEDEIEETIDDRIFGNILHASMQEIYSGMEGKVIAPEHLEQTIKDRERLRRIIEKHFREEMKIDELSGYLNLVKETILTYVTDILEHDRRLAPFVYIASEDRKPYEYPVCDTDGRELFRINLVAVYDRIDRVAEVSGPNPTFSKLRIVDYKTGKSRDGERSKLVVPEIETVFAENSNCSDEAFQIMLYSILYNNVSAISPNLYFVRDFHQNPELPTELVYEPDNKTPIADFNVHKETFRRAFNNLLADIFNPARPFTQTAEPKNCRYCQFKEICRRD